MKKISWFLLLLIVLIACAKKSDQYLIFKVDMKAAKKSGGFLPQKGDKLAVAFSFNNWLVDTFARQYTQNEHVYAVYYPDSLLNRPDTLQFRFVIVKAGDKKDLLWERIGQREFSYYELKNQPLFVFNQYYIAGETVNATFSVNMSNQMVLGFFKPEQGDQVVVSGDFCTWSEQGVLLHDEDDDKIYLAAVAVPKNYVDPLVYKYRILNKRNAILLNNGWETTGNRSFGLSEKDTVTGTAYFSDQKRCLRFVVNAAKWSRSGKFNPHAGEKLRIKLIFDGNTNTSDPLVEVENDIYEIALMLPEAESNGNYQLVTSKNVIMNPLQKFTLHDEGLKINID